MQGVSIVLTIVGYENSRHTSIVTRLWAACESISIFAGVIEY